MKTKNLISFLKHRVVIITITVLALLVCTACSGADHDTPQTQPATEPTLETPKVLPQMLCVSAVKDKNVQSIVHSQKALDGTISQIKIDGLCDVRIQLGNILMPLGEAFEKGLITVQEMSAWAAVDAHNGFCTGKTESRNGLTMFFYAYHDFDLIVCNDIYETPDGKDPFVQIFTLHHPSVNPNMLNTIPTGEYGGYLDLEDWGLSFETIEATPAGITFQIHQSGGQQLGDLKIVHFWLNNTSDLTDVADFSKEFDIETGDTSTVSLDWQEVCGTLPSGIYQLSFQIEDFYDATQIHPLMQNFHDRQFYGFEFTIP